MNSSYSPIGDLGSLLTPAQIAKFIQKAVPDIKLRKSLLYQTLEKQQWKVAAEQAHILKSTISLFSYNQLVTTLEQVESQNLPTIQSQAFRKSLVAQCEQLTNELEDYLSVLNL